MTNDNQRPAPSLIVDPDGKPVSSETVEREDDDKAIISAGANQPPKTLIVVPLDEHILFPWMTVPMVLSSGKAREALDFAMSQGPFLALVPRIQPTEKGKEDKPASPEDLLDTGVVAKILRALNLPDGNRSVLLECQTRCKIERYLRTSPYLIARVEFPADVWSDTMEHKALFRASQASLHELLKEIPGLPEGFNIAAANLEGPGQLTDFVATHLDLSRETKLSLLKTVDVAERLRIVAEALTQELELAKVAGRIREDLKAKVEKTQREYYLREQIKAIRKELGEEVDPKQLVSQEIEEKIESGELGEEAADRARKELKRLEILSPDSPEYNVISTYLQWIVDLPWKKETADNLDIKLAKDVLEADHYGLEEVKERIVEFLAVRKLKPDQQGAILCFSGPPGVGKTSLGQSIARAMKRKFFRFSLGGMRDEAEIKGHRRTYIGAMPGKILQGLRHVEVRNPVFMLDEIDKLGSDWRGDPSSAMLEVLDPAQNSTFRDHYLDIPFDLSHVMFICTANIKSSIPPPLLDRMEVIEIAGYILEEKVEIGKRYLIPRQLDVHGLKPQQVKMPESILPRIIEGWTAEAGVRNLERSIGRICRKIAARVASGETKPVTVTAGSLPDFLGPKRQRRESVPSKLKPGVAVGLAWTPVGGDILLIEATKMPGNGKFKVTGQLGSVMQESVELSLSYVKAHHDMFGIDVAALEKLDLHVHFPMGAVQKDGPSAGITITTALISLLSGHEGRRVRSKMAMTGEMTLRGEVLPVGGIKEKVLAARRAGIKRVVLPEENRVDIEEIPPHVLKGLSFAYARTYPEVMKEAF